jgi:hypothetical protein
VIDNVTAKEEEWQRSLAEGSSSSSPRMLGVCGQLLGGSLAATLSITECEVQPPNPLRCRVVAAALNNPIVDWVEPDREAVGRQVVSVSSHNNDASGVADEDGVLKHKKQGKRKKLSSWTEFKDLDPLSEAALLSCRNAVFEKPDRYFDPFASPIHFFRTAGINVSTDKTALSYDPDDLPARQLYRKASLQFPSTSSNVILPQIRLTTGKASILRSQDEEFIERIKASELRNSLRHRKISPKLFAAMEEDQPSEARKIREEVEKKFQLNILEGSGLWGYGPEELWRSDVESTGKWLTEVLTN